MLEDYAASLLQKILGNYVRGINKEALKISAWQGDVELKNMQLRPDALNALKLPVNVKAGFLGSVRLKIPWTKLGQEPVVVYLDQIFLLAEPALQVEGSSEEALQETKRNRVKELETKLMEAQNDLKAEMNTSWLGSVINTVIGNLKLSITNIHIRYEDVESNPGHPFAAGLTLGKLSAVTVDDEGNEIFATGANLDRIQKSVELQSLAFYLDSDSNPWKIKKPWEDLLPSEWSEIFEFGKKGNNTTEKVSLKEHRYILQPVTGNAKYTKSRLEEAKRTNQGLQNAFVDLDDVTLSLSKDGYRDLLKMADNFSAFNQRLKYAHYRPALPVKSDPKSWWKYAYKVLTEETKKASGRLAWDEVLKYAKLRKKYVSLYASLLKSDPSRVVIDDNEEINNLDRQLDTEVILQWRMLAHKFVQQTQPDLYSIKQKSKGSWWPFGSGSANDESEIKRFSEEDWERLNKIIGYKENSDEYLLSTQDKNLIQFLVKVRMRHNASKLVQGDECLADLSCDELVCNLKMYPETQIFDLKLGSYRLVSPYGLLAQSEKASNSLTGVFCYKPLNVQIDWSFKAKAEPCYVTYLKESIDLIVDFFKSSPTISQTLALETAAAVQMTIDGVKRSAQQQVTRALKDKSKFSLDLDIAAPKITIPTKFCPDGLNETKLMLDLGNLILRTQDMMGYDSSEGEDDMYLQFNLDLSDVSAFVADGDYQWSQSSESTGKLLLPVVDKCGIVAKLQQIQLENPLYPSTRLAVRLPSLSFHFSPARFHRLMAVARIFEGENDSTDQSVLQLQDQTNLEGWLSVLTWKGVGNREAIWQRRYLRLVGPFLYIFENPTSPVYKQWISLRSKQVHQVNSELAGGVENILALYDSGQLNPKVLEDGNALILLCDSDEAKHTWHKRLQEAIYRASGAPSISPISESPSFSRSTRGNNSFKADNDIRIEKLFLAGVLDELKVCFSCSYENNQDFKKILLSKEKRLFEFRAKGGQVELSMKAGNIMIGTILRSLEIEDQYSFTGASTSAPRYLARSFISSTDDTSMHPDASSSSLQKSKSRIRKSESEEKFFEASDDFDEVYGTPYPYEHQTSASEFSLKPPGFTRIAGLIPDLEVEDGDERVVEKKNEGDTLGSFVKAQIVIFDQSSPQYRNLDNRVIVTLATLSFFCHRPTIVAIVEFANAINFVEAKDNGAVNGIKSETYSGPITKESEIEDETGSTDTRSLAIKGLLGKGKSRVIFHLTLNMAKAAIFLMNEASGTIATLSQNNLLTEIKVYPSSFSIKAALGNLKISDDSLSQSHPYFWACDMRNPGGTSFVEIDFMSFSPDDEDYRGYDYSLTGELSEVRIVYLNRFIQEIVGYFMGLVPKNVESVVKLKDNVTNSEKLVSKTDIEGSPAIKLDLSLSRPIILMPRSTNSLDFLELDVLTITVQNTFQWLCGDKSNMNAVHLESMTIKVKDINLCIGVDMVRGETIIQDVNGLSLEIRRSLRDLSHLMPEVEAAVKIQVLKAALSNKEYEIITECALSNLSEAPNIVPSLYNEECPPHITNDDAIASSSLVLPEASMESGPSQNNEVAPWIALKFSVAVNLVELSLHSGSSRDSPLATLQATGAWLLYKSNTLNQGFLFATLKGFSVLDDREGTREEFRLAIGKSMTVRDTSSNDEHENFGEPVPVPVHIGKIFEKELGFKPIPSMLLLDATFKKDSTNISLCIQRPKFLVALDFLLDFVEFFVPSFGAVLSNEDDKDLQQILPAIVFQGQIYAQDCSVLSISPQKPLIADDERFDHFIYDGKGGKLLLHDSNGETLSGPSLETIIFVGSGKRLQFRNVTVVDGEYLDSCISLGSESAYSASEEDGVFLEREERDSALASNVELAGAGDVRKSVSANSSAEIIVELQAIGPELAFYSSSKSVVDQSALSNKVIHANTDAFCRLVVKGDSMEMSGNILGLKMESNGIRVLEPLDTSIKYSSVSGRTIINLNLSEIYMNFSFSILRLFLAVQEDILAFLRTSSKKTTELCSQFDNVATVHGHGNDRTYSFWRPRAPSGFATLGDCLTPLNEPPTKGVLAVNTSLVRVKKPVSYKLIWEERPSSGKSEGCSIWFPIAPKGYISMGCVASTGNSEPPLSSALCILSSYVSSSALRDCIVLKTDQSPAGTAFWRMDNSFGSFLPEDTENMSSNLIGKPYDLRHMLFTNNSEPSTQSFPKIHSHNSQRYSNNIEGKDPVSSGQLLEAVENVELVWWNNGSSSQKKLSIWRPVVPPGMVYFGDIAVGGYEQPNSAIVLHDTGDETFLKRPTNFKFASRIKKQRRIEGISFWIPEPPPGFISLGYIASKTVPTPEDFPALRCVRSDMVVGDQFTDESVWDSLGTRVSEDFSIWSIQGDNFGTFIVRNGFRKPKKRLALKLAEPPQSSSDSMVIDAEIKSFSAVAFDDYGGLMMPLFGVSLGNIGFRMHGRPDSLIATASFSLVARSFNDKNDSWEPLIEQTDGFVRYQYDINLPGFPSQLRITSTQDLNLNVSVSNANMIFQAYSSWNNLGHIDESSKQRVKSQEVVSPSSSEKRILDVHQRRNYYIVPQNNLGQDIYIRSHELKGFPGIIKLSSGDDRLVRVPIPKNSMHSHFTGKHHGVSRSMVSVIIAEAELRTQGEGLSTSEYMTAVQLYSNRSSEMPLHKQCARTCAFFSESSSRGIASVKWKEMFFFKVDNLDDYILEFLVIDLGRGEPVGKFCAPLNELVLELSFNSSETHCELTWRDLASAKVQENGMNSTAESETVGRIRFAVVHSTRPKPQPDEQDKGAHGIRNKSSLIQISPSMDGPWTTVKLNYATPFASWRFGNDVIASEIALRENDRYVKIRSLVSVKNSTDYVIEVRLKGRYDEVNEDMVATDEFVQTQTYSNMTGWTDDWHEGPDNIELPAGWHWMDDWHLNTESTGTSEGWVYSQEETNKRQRKWIRHRKYTIYEKETQIPIGLLNPGSMIPLPLQCLTNPNLSYALQIRPASTDNSSDSSNFLWSTIKVESQSNEICVSNLFECDKILFCSQLNGSPSSSDASVGVWFCASVEAKEIGKDIHSDPIHDWIIVFKSPLSLAYYLPFPAQYSVIIGNELDGESDICANGNFVPGTTVKIHNAGPEDPLYLSLVPQGGWEPMHPVIISHANRAVSKLINIRNTFSQRIVQITLEHNFDKDCPYSKVIRMYVPYWISCARLPPLSLCITSISGKERSSFSLVSRSSEKSEKTAWKITPDEMVDGYTIASVLNFKGLGLSASITTQGRESFGPVKELTPLGDMDGSIYLLARDTSGKCTKILVSSKPSSFQAVPTKAIMIRPFMTFTNMVGQDIFIKLNGSDEPNMLLASDWKVSFTYSDDASPDKIQVRLGDTNWSRPVVISKEDSIVIVMRKQDDTKKFLRAEVRGYEEGSRYLIAFRLGPSEGPIRIENRTRDATILIQQADLGEEAWIQLAPRTTKKYSLDDPYGRKVLEAGIHSKGETYYHFIDLDNPNESSMNLRQRNGIKLDIMDVGDVKVVRFGNERREMQMEGCEVLSSVQKELQRGPIVQFEVVVELGVVGVSLIDHRPKELLYLHLQRVCVSYQSGTVSRFKLRIGHLQVDNELPLTVMPVLLAPEETPDLNHPVFKSNIAISNEKTDGTEVYPYVHLRVTKSLWRLNIHEPIIWALVDFYRNLCFNDLPSTSTVTQVDPEIRIEIIDISEIRLKISLETAPAQRPRGVLGIWSPIFSAVGNAFKFQVHLRRVEHRNRYMKKSNVITAITNRVKRDLVHNPLHLIFSLDVLSMTKSTLASLSRGFAELSSDGQFLQLRSKQVSSRKITGVGDGIVQGTEALAQGVAFGVSGVVTKPIESAKQRGLLGFADGLGRAFLGFLVQPLSGFLDFASLTVDGIGASFIRCLEILNNKAVAQRIRNPRAIRAVGVVREYNEREAIGQMVLYLAEASRHLACTDLFREPSKYAWSDYYEDHFIVPYQRIVLVTNKRVMLLQCQDMDKMDKKPSKILWDVAWEEVLALELAKRSHTKPCMLIIHLKTCTKSDNFSRYIRCKVAEEQDDSEPQAVLICSTVRRVWKAYQADKRVILLKVPSSQRHVHFFSDESEERESSNVSRAIIKPGRSPSPERFVKYTVNFKKIWSSEREVGSRCSLFKKQVFDDSTICSIWRPLCPEGYVSVGDVVHVGTHQPTVAAVYCNSADNFALPIGYDLVWRNCAEDYNEPVTIWLPRAPEGYKTLGCVAVASFEEPASDSVYCVNSRIAEETSFEDQLVWAPSDSFPWSCYIYQVHSEALQFIALRLRKEEMLNWRPMRVTDPSSL